jgi:hypothetical protein
MTHSALGRLDAQREGKHRSGNGLVLGTPGPGPL